jgi:hypothetical protein
VTEIVHAKAGQISPLQDTMKDTPEVASLIQSGLIVRTEPRRVPPSARHGFELPPGPIRLQFEDQFGAEVHCSDLSSLGRIHLSAESRRPFDPDSALTDGLYPPVGARDRAPTSSFMPMLLRIPRRPGQDFQPKQGGSAQPFFCKVASIESVFETKCIRIGSFIDPCHRTH